MNTKGINRLKMYKAVQSVCASNEAAWNAVPAFVAAYDRFAAKITELDHLSFVQGIGTVGVRKVKDKERETTADRAHQIASALRALATDSGTLPYWNSYTLHVSNCCTVQTVTMLCNS